MTITEGLAEIKTIGKRLEKKREFVLAYLWRQEKLKDPLEKEGGSRAAVQRERQAIQSLEERIIKIRRAIAAANEREWITIGTVERPIADWLTWRREVADGQSAFLSRMRNTISTVRNDAQKKGLQVVSKEGADVAPNDVVVNLSEQELAQSGESLENVLGTLDGQLSLKNATVMITFED